jgi:hypothetical protein
MDSDKTHRKTLVGLGIAREGIAVSESTAFLGYAESMCDDVACRMGKVCVSGPVFPISVMQHPRVLRSDTVG